MVLLPVVFVPLATSVVVVAVVDLALKVARSAAAASASGVWSGSRRALKLRGRRRWCSRSRSACRPRSRRRRSSVRSMHRWMVQLRGDVTSGVRRHRRDDMALGARRRRRRCARDDARRRFDAGLLAALGEIGEDADKPFERNCCPWWSSASSRERCARTVLVATLEQRSISPRTSRSRHSPPPPPVSEVRHA